MIEPDKEKRLLNWEDFEKVEMRIGTIRSAQPFPEARRPALTLEIDFGPFGMRKSSAQITELYSPQYLVGTQVIAVVNFPPKRIAGFRSECLVLGVVGQPSGVVLLQPDRPVENGARIA